MVDSVLSIGLKGVLSGVEAAHQAAQDIVAATTVQASSEGEAVESSPAATVDLTQAALDLQASEQQVMASATVVKSADEMLGTLLDIKA